jgi:glycosyltransferase involved in cell wall biosynthesis
MNPARKRPVICIAGSHHISEREGGVEIQTFFLGTILNRSGWQVVYLSPSIRGYRGWQKSDDVPDIFWYPNAAAPWEIDRRLVSRALTAISPSLVYMRGRSALQESGVVSRWCRTHRIPVRFGLSSDSDLERFSRTRALWKSNRPLWRKIGVTPYRLWSDHRLRATIKSADMLIVQNQEQETAGKALNTNLQLIPSIHPEVNDVVRKTEPPTVVWIANLRPGKQAHLFIKLATACRDLKVRFIMILGQTRKAKDLEPLWNSADKLDNLIPKGSVSRQEVEEILAGAVCLVNTSVPHLEGFPNTFIQSWLRETPVVSLETDPGGILETQKIGFCSHEFDALVRDVRTLVKNPSLQQEMGRRARQVAERYHGLTRNSHVVVEQFNPNSLKGEG